MSDKIYEMLQIFENSLPEAISSQIPIDGHNTIHNTRVVGVTKVKTASG